MAQQDWWHLENAGIQVQSSAWLSTFRIWCCRSCSLGHNYGWDLIPCPGTPYDVGQPKKKKKLWKNLNLYVFAISVHY